MSEPKMLPPKLPDAAARALRHVDAGTGCRNEIADIAAGMIRDLSVLDAAEVLRFVGRKTNPEILEVDLDTNSVTRAGLTMKLQGAQAALLFKLAERPGTVVPLGDLRCAVWGRAGAGAHSGATLRTMVSGLRHRLAPLHATIISQHSKGYRLELQDEQENRL